MEMSELSPQDLISWTLWELDEGGDVHSWVGTRGDTPAENLLDASADARWITKSANVACVHKAWRDSNFVGIIVSNAILFVPNIEGSIN